MAALPYPGLPAGSLPIERPETGYRLAKKLWLGLQILDPPADSEALRSLAIFAQSLTPVVVLRPDEGLLLEVQGSLKYFAGLAAIKERLAAELEQHGWIYRLAAAPTKLAASWLVRSKSVDITDQSSLAGAIGKLPLAATRWPEKVQLMLRQMGLSSIADCLRLPRAGFARRIGQARLDDLDRALGKKPDFHDAYQLPQNLCQTVDFSVETIDQALFAEAISGIVASFEQELRQRQMQIKEVELKFRHLRSETTRTWMRFVDPVHEHERIFNPLLARIERMALSEPAIALSLETGTLQPLKTETPGLLAPLDASAGPTQAVPEYALVECLRGRFGTRHVFGIDSVAEHRPEHAWRRWTDSPIPQSQDDPTGLQHGRPLWLLPKPQKKWSQLPRPPKPHSTRSESLWDVRGVSPASSAAQRGLSEPATHPLHPKGSTDPERIESGWWDGGDVRRDYYVVLGAAGEKLWFYRDCETHEWYLHGIFG